MSYTNGLDDPSAHFNTITYAFATTPDNRVFTFDGNSDLQPDFSWIKRRDAATGNILQDSSRGVTKYLHSEGTTAESTYSNYLKSFNTNGLTIGGGDGATNQGSGGTGVIWAWKAGGGTTATNTTGSVDSVVQANTDAGFSIVTYTGTGANITVGHGLGVAPSAIIIKSRSNTLPWVVWTAGMASGTTSVAELNTNGPEQTVSNYWYNGFSSTTFGLGTGTYSHNTDDQTYIAYCFAEKQGYNKFGKYLGNGNANGSFVYTGFKPAWVMVRGTSNGYHWTIWDSKRNPHNEVKERINANSGDAAYAGTSGNDYVDFLSNGFKIKSTRSASNVANVTYIYMAFAENPFVTSTGTPTTAR